MKQNDERELTTIRMQGKQLDKRKSEYVKKDICPYPRRLMRRFKLPRSVGADKAKSSIRESKAKVR